MHIVAHAIDKPDALPRRLEIIDAHRAYLAEAPAKHGVKGLLSGPLTEDDGETMKGSFFLFDAPGRAAVEALIAGDPISQADVWDHVHITAVMIRQNNMGN